MLDRYNTKLVISKLLTCDTFKISTCHTDFICLSFIILFDTHELYGFIWNPYAWNSLTNFLYNSSALCIRPYNDFFIWTHESGFPLLPIMTQFQYILGVTLTTRSACAPSSNIRMSSYFYVGKYAHKMSNMAMPWPSCASTSVVMNTDYVETLDKAAYSLFIVSHCFLPSAHVFLFISPLPFYFRDIRDATDSTLYFLLYWLFPLVQRFIGHAIMSVPLRLSIYCAP